MGCRSPDTCGGERAGPASRARSRAARLMHVGCGAGPALRARSRDTSLMHVGCCTQGLHRGRDRARGGRGRASRRGGRHSADAARGARKFYRGGRHRGGRRAVPCALPSMHALHSPSIWRSSLSAVCTTSMVCLRSVCTLFDVQRAPTEDGCCASLPNATILLPFDSGTACGLASSSKHAVQRLRARTRPYWRR